MIEKIYVTFSYSPFDYFINIILNKINIILNKILNKSILKWLLITQLWHDFQLMLCNDSIHAVIINDVLFIGYLRCIIERYFLKKSRKEKHY